MLVFRMRDDIHRRLPLTRAWKRVVKACVRDAETPFRAPLLEQAARTELGDLRPVVVQDAARELSSTQGSLFPGEAFRVTVTPASPMEAAFQRECAAIVEARLPAPEALARALGRALGERVGAIVREIRAQLSVDFPRECAELVMRFVAAAHRADLATLARGHLAGEPAQRPARLALALDLDSDLRGQP
jgi:hypothetical protein